MQISRRSDSLSADGAHCRQAGSSTLDRFIIHIFTETLKRLTDLRWLNLFEVEYADDAGKRSKWEFASRQREPALGRRAPAPDAVFIVPILKTAQENRLVVTREYRVPLGGYEHSFPAGLHEPGESLETTIRRELAEETGLTLAKILAASPPVIASAGMSDESAVIAFVECTGEPSTDGAEGMEEIEILVLDYQQLLDLRRAPVTFSAKAWIVLLLFEALGEIAWPGGNS